MYLSVSACQWWLPASLVRSPAAGVWLLVRNDRYNGNQLPSRDRQAADVELVEPVFDPLALSAIVITQPSQVHHVLV